MDDVIEATEVSKPRHRRPDREVLIKTGDEVTRFSVWYYHYRVPFAEWVNDNPMYKGQPKYLTRIKEAQQRGPFDYAHTGGACICVLREEGVSEDTPISERTWVGVALCSMSEKFNKRKGKIIAFNRAMAARNEYDAPIESPEIFYPVPLNTVSNVVRTFMAD